MEILYLQGMLVVDCCSITTSAVLISSPLKSTTSRKAHPTPQTWVCRNSTYRPFPATTYLNQPPCRLRRSYFLLEWIVEDSSLASWWKHFPQSIVAKGKGVYSEMLWQSWRSCHPLNRGCPSSTPLPISCYTAQWGPCHHQRRVSTLDVIILFETSRREGHELFILPLWNTSTLVPRHLVDEFKEPNMSELIHLLPCIPSFPVYDSDSDGRWLHTHTHIGTLGNGWSRFWTLSMFWPILSSTWWLRMGYGYEYAPQIHRRSGSTEPCYALWLKSTWNRPKHQACATGTHTYGSLPVKSVHFVVCPGKLFPQISFA